MGFFMDWSAKPYASLVGVSASGATQGELQSEFYKRNEEAIQFQRLCYALGSSSVLRGLLTSMRVNPTSYC